MSMQARTSLNVVDNDIGALYLAPQSCGEAMRQEDASDWVKSISVEFENLHHRGVLMRWRHPWTHVSMRGAWYLFTEKVNSNGDVIRKKVRVVAKGFTEVWGEDYWHTYSLTLGHDTLFTC